MEILPGAARSSEAAEYMRRILCSLESASDWPHGASLMYICRVSARRRLNIFGSPILQGAVKQTQTRSDIIIKRQF